MAQDPRPADQPLDDTPTMAPTDDNPAAPPPDAATAAAPPSVGRGDPGVTATSRNLPTDFEMVESTLEDRNLLVVMRGVSRSFDGRRVIDHIDLTVPRGTILGIIGPSGAGKTTTIRMLTGALRPTDGDVRVLGVEPRRFKRRDRVRIGYMPQLFMLYEDLTAGENVDFVGSLF